MKIVLQTAPTIEPITLSELKGHLRLDSETFDGNLTLTQSLAFGSHDITATYTILGTGVDVLGNEADVLLHAGTNGATGTVDTKIQESDDNVTYTDWAGGAFTQITEANDNADYKMQYTGTKQYIRTASKVLLAACEFGTSILINASTTPEDSLLTRIIKASRELVEDITRRALLTQTWDYYLEEWPKCDDIDIPLGNLQSVTSVSFHDTDGTETTLTDGTDYLVVTNGEGIGEIVLPYGVTWPTGVLYPANPIKIRFVAGWTTAALVPSKIKAAMLLICADLYENREGRVFAMAGGQSYQENEMVSGLLSSARLWNEF